MKRGHFIFANDRLLSLQQVLDHRASSLRTAPARSQGIFPCNIFCSEIRLITVRYPCLKRFARKAQKHFRATWDQGIEESVIALCRFGRRATCQAALICLGLWITTGSVVQATRAQTAPQPTSQSASGAKPVGTIKSISGNTITLTTDAGTDVTVLVQDATKLLRIAPGQTDLKDATPLQLPDVQVGDRILVRGKLADDGKSVLATSLIAMKKEDISQKQTREREEWQKHGAGGLVNSVDPATSTITVSLPAIGEKKNLTVHLLKDTVLRRYSPDSVKFDDARPAPLAQILPGDQLRARGSRSADGTELTAVEIVSGTFRNISGILAAVDASASTMTLQDLATKKTVTVKVTSESQLRKLIPQMAQRIALRLKGTPADSAAAAADGPASAANTPPFPDSRGAPAGAPRTGGGPPGGSGGMGRAGGGPPDLQQAINRMPASALSDFQKGDAVMLVATQGGSDGMPIAITLLGGVEPILQASPNSNASTILSPWSLGSGAGGEAAAP